VRNNQPVSHQEFPFPDGQTLVSTTDLKGRILYCNPAFVAVSGFAREELLGQPHNIVRHPDMPEEAYRDMWATIAAGQPWSAAVKNRRKDGSHYWVKANVTPIMQGGQPAGYMSVRTQPSRAEVQGAEALYATMRAEAKVGHLVHRLEGGQVQRDTLPARLQRALRPELAAQVGWVTGVLCSVAAFGSALWGGEAVGDPWLWLEAVGVGALGGVAAALTVGKMVLRPVQRLVTIANRMASGDLTQTIAAEGFGAVARMTHALSQLNVNLRSIVRDARDEVVHMRDATREIAAGNQDLSSRTESQAASLEETAASMEQITGTLRQSTDSAAQAAQLAARASEVTTQGSEAIHQMTRTMHGISESSRRIGEIIAVIDGIAFQTNILALNAAVEAARAGEQGRGFAVVASEVRSLSHRTTDAAREVKRLIEDSVAQVQAGSQASEQTRQTMDDALAAVRQVTQVIDEISHGAREQLSGVAQINQAVAALDTITQQNAALVEQVAAAAVQLQGRAVAVSESVQVFTLDSRGHAPAPDAAALRRGARAAVAQPA